MKKLRLVMYSSIAIFLLSSCESIDISNIAKAPEFLKSKVVQSVNFSQRVESKAAVPLPDIINKVPAGADITNGFKLAVKSAVEIDPDVLAARERARGRAAATAYAKTQKDFQFSSTIYGGVEDISDETAGVALVLNARKFVFDGGQIDSKIAAERFLAEAAEFGLQQKLNESALAASQVWVELKRYEALNSLIKSRLLVLDPLIDQLERVADAGVGDVSQVAAAERTVSLIRVIEADIVERLELAKVNFINIFGALPDNPQFDFMFVSQAVPKSIDNTSISKAPALLAAYSSYLARLSSLSAVENKDNFSVGLETKFQRPFGGSGYDSDESIGLVVRRTLYAGDQLEAEIRVSRAEVESQLHTLRATYRSAKVAVETAQQTINANEKAVELAKKNAKSAHEEIKFLRKQLVIGQSTLDSVLGAEARLYEAESKEINFISDTKNAELTILSSMGFLRLFDRG